MNITDIDDKIIKRARQNHLYENYLSENNNLEKVLYDCNQVMLHFQTVVETTTDVDKRAMNERLFNSLTEAVRKVSESIESRDADKIESSKQSLLVEAKDLLSDWLDKQAGAGVTENAIFSKLPNYWEEKFHQDMEALNVSPIF
jgi:cysteinyl-tRNA synthetase